MNLETLEETVINNFIGNKIYEEIPQDSYSNFSYPKWLSVMKFTTQRYKIPGYGYLMTMHTKTLFGMELLTSSFTPSEGVSVPYLLIDVMTMGRKRTVFIEYYDCTKNHPEMKNLESVKNRYNDIPEYQEKPKWYVSERTPYSLIKCGTHDIDGKLNNMIVESIKAYNKELEDASIDKDNIPGLSDFRKRMVNEGNPSSSILERIYGKEGAETFFNTCVMPL